MNENEVNHLCDMILKVLCQKLPELLPDTFYDDIAEKISVRVCNYLKESGAMELSSLDAQEAANLAAVMMEKLYPGIEIKSLEE